MTATSQHACATAARIAALLAILSSAPMSPSTAANSTGFSGQTTLTVAITSPGDKALVSGTIGIEAKASWGQIAGVQFFVDGAPLHAEDTVAPYLVDWDTTTTTHAEASLYTARTVTAVARDAAGSSTISRAVTVYVANSTEAVIRVEDTHPAIAYIGDLWRPADASKPWSGGTAAYGPPTWDEYGRFTHALFRFTGTGVRWIGSRGPNGRYARVTLDGVVTVVNTYAPEEMLNVELFAASGLPAAGHNLLIVPDAGGIILDAFDVTTTGGTWDTTPPSATITTPADGSVVSGAIVLSANASDSSGIAGVQFRVDNYNLLTEDTEAPYSVPWDTTVVSDGRYWLTAVARDVQGNRSGPGIWVTVDNTAPTIMIAAPVSGATVSGTTTVSGDASDNTKIVGVQFRLDGADLGAEDTVAPYSIDWDTATSADGTHTVTAVVRDVVGHTSSAATVVVTVANMRETFVSGDVVVSLQTGEVQWRRPDGSFYKTLAGSIPGTAAGTRFDAGGNLYVTRWRLGDDPDHTGNITEMFGASGQSLGTFGSGYDCDPSAIVFDPAGTAYVGQAGCSGTILKLVPGEPPMVLPAAPDNQGSFWVDLAADGCTIFYTSWGPNVKRFDGCGGAQLADFNVEPLPGGEAHDLRVLPEGGVLVSSGEVIARLDSFGRLVQTYSVPGEYSPWTGVDLVGDGTFWAGNYESSNVYRFDLATGAVLSWFNTGTAPHTVIDVAVKK